MPCSWGPFCYLGAAGLDHTTGASYRLHDRISWIFVKSGDSLQHGEGILNERMF